MEYYKSMHVYLEYIICVQRMHIILLPHLTHLRHIIYLRYSMTSNINVLLVYWILPHIQIPKQIAGVKCKLTSCIILCINKNRF